MLPIENSPGTGEKSGTATQRIFEKMKLINTCSRILAYEAKTLHEAKSAATRTRAGEAESPLFNTDLGGPPPAKRPRIARGRAQPQPGPSAPSAGTGILFFLSSSLLLAYTGPEYNKYFKIFKNQGQT
jgi:hypothetical protein